MKVLDTQTLRKLPQVLADQPTMRTILEKGRIPLLKQKQSPWPKRLEMIGAVMAGATIIMKLIGRKKTDK